MLKLLIWGTGQVARNFIENSFKEGRNVFDRYDVLGFIDNDEEKRKLKFYDRAVFSPSILENEKVAVDKIVILTNSYEIIKSQIIQEYPKLQYKLENRYFFYKESLLKRYNRVCDKEIVEVINYVQKNGLNVFNYSFVQKYDALKIEVNFDERQGMYWVNHHGYRMYISRLYKTEKDVVRYYKSLLIEQDIKSPHKYLDGEFSVKESDVVVDVGAAEGIFSLEVIKDASRIYMIEADENWIDALKLTFADYSDKVFIIKGFASSYCDGDLIALDDTIHEEIDFIKMDIEGNEWEALQGSRQLLKNSKHVKMAICSYHRDFDQVLIEDFMRNMGIIYSATGGYMWYPYGENKYPTKLNRGIIRGEIWNS